MTTPSVPITYSLNRQGPAAATYYPAVAQFTDIVLAHAEPALMPAAKKYRNFLIGFRLEEPRTPEEYLFEMLNLGILWKRYGATALAVRYAPFRMLAALGGWRKSHPAFKPVIDRIRGWAFALFLVPSHEGPEVRIPRTMNDLYRLVAWLEATGDFREDAFRYIRWLGFLGTLPEKDLAAVMDMTIEFADWFERESAVSLQQFTPNVGAFIVAHQRQYRWREDQFSCLRSRMEYHLNMVGAEIMNRAFRKEFKSCTQRTVLLPGCMRLRSADKCEGGKNEKGIRCTGCEPSCNVNRIREHGKRNNFDVMIIPHSTDLSKWKSAPDDEPSAVIGVACVSVLVQGGWELKRNNVPAQCLLLNECGCKKHWDTTGFPTSLDVRELQRIVNN